MSEAEQADKANDSTDDELTESEFFERLSIEGATTDGGFFMPRGSGRQRRYYRYDPESVKGFDAVRGDDGDVDHQEVAAHDSAVEEQVDKDHMAESVYPQVRDGQGAFGLVRIESASEEGESPGSGSGRRIDFEPIADDSDVLETVRRNYDDHGFFGEDEDGETKVVSLAHPDARLMGYITGSHVQSLPAEGMTTVDDYRNAVYQALGADLSDTDGADPIVDFDSPADVPIMTEDMKDILRESGNSLDEETRDKLSRQVKARWEDGEYDHLRGGDDGD